MNTQHSEECTAQLGELICGLAEGHTGAHEDGVAGWTDWGFVFDANGTN